MIKKWQLSLIILENQIREDREGWNDLKVHFVLFVLGILLCPTVKLFVRHSFLHLMENIDSIKKMNLVELVLPYLLCMESKSLRPTNKVVFQLLLVFYGNVLCPYI